VAAAGANGAWWRRREEVQQQRAPDWHGRQQTQQTQQARQARQTQQARQGMSGSADDKGWSGGTLPWHAIHVAGWLLEDGAGEQAWAWAWAWADAVAEWQQEVSWRGTDSTWLQGLGACTGADRPASFSEILPRRTGPRIGNTAPCRLVAGGVLGAGKSTRAERVA
jgi:hypothetical protein